MLRLEGKEYVVQDGDVVEFRFEGNEVQVSKLGSAVDWLKPGVEWDFLKEACHGFTPDFMQERNQPATQERGFGE